MEVTYCCRQGWRFWLRLVRTNPLMNNTSLQRFGFGQEINASGVMSDLTREKKQIHFGMQQRMNITWLGKLLWAHTCTGTDLLTVLVNMFLSGFQAFTPTCVSEARNCPGVWPTVEKCPAQFQLGRGKKGEKLSRPRKVGVASGMAVPFQHLLAQRRLQFP